MVQQLYHGIAAYSRYLVGTAPAYIIFITSKFRWWHAAAAGCVHLQLHAARCAHAADGSACARCALHLAPAAGKPAGTTDLSFEWVPGISYFD